MPIEIMKISRMKTRLKVQGKLMAAIGVTIMRIMIQPTPWKKRMMRVKLRNRALLSMKVRAPRRAEKRMVMERPKIMSLRRPQRALNLLRIKPRKMLGSE